MNLQPISRHFLKIPGAGFVINENVSIVYELNHYHIHAHFAHNIQFYELFITKYTEYLPNFCNYRSLPYVQNCLKTNTVPHFLVMDSQSSYTKKVSFLNVAEFTNPLKFLRMTRDCCPDQNDKQRDWCIGWKTLSLDSE